MKTKPCERCGVPVEGDYSHDGQLLAGYPIVVVAICDKCAEIREAECIEEERARQRRERWQQDPSDN